MSKSLPYLRLVVEQIKNIPKERRAWQMIGGVLIEKSVG